MVEIGSVTGPHMECGGSDCICFRSIILPKELNNVWFRDFGIVPFYLLHVGNLSIEWYKNDCFLCISRAARSVSLCAWYMGPLSCL